MLDSKSSGTESSSASLSAIFSLKFPFKLTKDQIEAVDAWTTNGCRGSIIYSTGTGKTEIAFECAKRAAERDHNSSFNILFLVPRIVLVQQNINRLIKYGIPVDKVGAYFGERKEIREITISTYQSAINDLDLINNSSMIIFDEVHLVSDTATTLRKVLTAAVRRYMIRDAVKDKRLARPVVIPIKVDLTRDEKKIYVGCSIKIRNISGYLHTSDPKSIISMLRRGGRSAGLAKTWFANVKERKNLKQHINIFEGFISLSSVDIVCVYALDYKDNIVSTLTSFRATQKFLFR
jgi:superfamily II DNA or RNA helicase